MTDCLIDLTILLVHRLPQQSIDSTTILISLLITTMTLVIVVLATVFGAAITAGQTDIQQHRWVTKMLYEVLENYVPDGGSTCNRDGQTYRQGLEDLKLWATQSELINNVCNVLTRSTIIVFIYICLCIKSHSRICLLVPTMITEYCNCVQFIFSLSS